MTTRHDLPSGGWVEIRDHRELTGRDVRKVNSSITAGGAQAIVEQRAALTEILVEGWSFDYPLPATPAVVDLLRADDYVALDALSHPAWQLVTGRSVIPNSDHHEDPTQPTQDGSE